MTSRPRPRRTARVSMTLAALAVVAVTGSTASYAADGAGVDIVNTETVQIYTSADGKVTSKRVYEQLSLSGKGRVELSNPVSTDGLRNLDGFGGFSVENGNQVVDTKVDGEEKLRSVSDFDGTLPLSLDVAYELDGKPVEADDVVGRSGELTATYTIENVSGVPTEVTFDDGKGGTITETVDVPVPMVGSLTTVAPSTFRSVRSEQANMAGDGKGGTKLSFTVTLIPPIGSTSATFGYTADIVDGVVPRADLTALPVNPLLSPSFKTAATSYQGGAETGVELARGAVEIDTNLLKLRDGASDLLSGLLQLSDGADQLSAGLTNDAVPGSQKLAAGAGELADGIGQLDVGAAKLSTGAGTAADGSKKLAAGAGQLSSGVGTLDGKLPILTSGVGQLAAGQAGLAAGLTKLYDGVQALSPSVRDQLKTNAEYQQLLGALQSVVAGIGTPTDSGATLLGGLNQLKAGLDGATARVDQAAVDLFGAINGPASADGTVAKLKATILSVQGVPDCGPQCRGTLDQVAAGVGVAQTASLNKLREGLIELSAGIVARATGPTGGIAQLKAGLSNGNAATCDRTKTGSPLDDCGLSQAVQLVQVGVPVLVDGITSNISKTLLASIGVPSPGCVPTATLRCAAAALDKGGDDLLSGVGELIGGVDQLDAGGRTLAAGAGDLSSGLDRLSDGAGQLADGTGTARAGSVRLSDGADQLASGLGDAADGSGRLAAGLTEAAAGTPQLVDGATRLSAEGTKKLVAAGESTAQNYGEMYATLEAGAQRAQTEDMALGAPEGASGLTAYSYVIQGEDGEGNRNLVRGLMGGLLLAAGAGVVALRRRIV
ncbi:MAG: hypothetical protein LH468_03120 [Nocardioides sp.]|nr:hypothetical protein [Nocardioides sp.]